MTTSSDKDLERSGRPRIRVEERHGDLLRQRVDALVNPWNRNFVPRWLLRPGGVSGQLKSVTGPRPWKELAAHGTLAVGQAVITGGGNLEPDLIHVAGINARWRGTRESITLSCRNAVVAAWTSRYASIAMPVIGSGHGSFPAPEALRLIKEALAPFESASPPTLTVLIVLR